MFWAIPILLDIPIPLDTLMLLGTHIPLDTLTLLDIPIPSMVILMDTLMDMLVIMDMERGKQMLKLHLMLMQMLHQTQMRMRMQMQMLIPTMDIMAMFIPLITMAIETMVPLHIVIDTYLDT